LVDIVLSTVNIVIDTCSFQNYNENVPGDETPRLFRENSPFTQPESSDYV